MTIHKKGLSPIEMSKRNDKIFVSNSFWMGVSFVAHKDSTAKDNHQR